MEIYSTLFYQFMALLIGCTKLMLHFSIDSRAHERLESWNNNVLAELSYPVLFYFVRIGLMDFWTLGWGEELPFCSGCTCTRIQSALTLRAVGMSWKWYSVGCVLQTSPSHRWGRCHQNWWSVLVSLRAYRTRVQRCWGVKQPTEKEGPQRDERDGNSEASVL